jgi:hypothetical protein
MYLNYFVWLSPLQGHVILSCVVMLWNVLNKLRWGFALLYFQLLSVISQVISIWYAFSAEIIQGNTFCSILLKDK